MRVRVKGGRKSQPDDRDRHFSDLGNSHCFASSVQGSCLVSLTNVIREVELKAHRTGGTPGDPFRQRASLVF